VIVELLVTACFVPAVVFPLYYATHRWWSTEPGWAVMIMAVSLAVVMTIIFLAVVFDVRLGEWVRVLIYGVMAFAFWTKLIVLIYVSRPSYVPRYNRRSTDRDPTRDSA
jgi:hypothetical protein